MHKGRLEAFSDGVIAIIITIMVLELKVPHGTALEDLKPLVPVMMSYVLSFVYLGIYWNNHHHLLTVVQRVSGGVLWANMHLLFWLSLIPFATAWMGENHFAAVPTAVYGGVLFMAAIAFAILVRVLINTQGQSSTLKAVVGGDFKGKLSPIIYLAGVGCTFVEPRVSLALYAAVAGMWLIPDTRIERAVSEAHK